MPPCKGYRAAFIYHVWLLPFYLLLFPLRLANGTRHKNSAQFPFKKATLMALKKGDISHRIHQRGLQAIQRTGE
jgi:hypothetical protein